VLAAVVSRFARLSLLAGHSSMVAAGIAAAKVSKVEVCEIGPMAAKLKGKGEPVRRGQRH
jgi:hypothetical protein